MVAYGQDVARLLYPAWQREVLSREDPAPARQRPPG
jgi:hypothetical protein